MSPAPQLTPAALRILWAMDPAAFLRDFRPPPALGHFLLSLYPAMPPEQRRRLLERVPDLLREDLAERSADQAYAATDAAVRGLLPLALMRAGRFQDEAFGYLLTLRPVEDRDTAHLAVMAAWDACVVLSRWCEPPDQLPCLAAREARDAATAAEWAHAAWAESCGRHAAFAAAFCARLAPEETWELAFTCLDRMLGPDQGSAA